MSAPDIFLLVVLSLARLDMPSGTCTAVMVADGLFVTSKHCVQDPKLTIEGAAVEVVAQHPTQDLALVKAPKGSRSALRVRKKSLREGEPVATVGFPMGEGPVITVGVWGARTQADGTTYIAAQTGPGMSGSPVVDRDGRLVTITIGVLKTGGLGLGASPEQLQEFLRAQGVLF